MKQKREGESEGARARARVRVRGGHKANRMTDREENRVGSHERKSKRQLPRCMRAFPNNIEQVCGTLVETKMKNDKEDVEGPPTYIAEKNTLCFIQTNAYTYMYLTTTKIENNNTHRQSRIIIDCRTSTESIRNAQEQQRSIYVYTVNTESAAQQFYARVCVYFCLFKKH